MRGKRSNSPICSQNYFRIKLSMKLLDQKCLQTFYVISFINECIKVSIMVVPDHLIGECIFLIWFLHYICTSNAYRNMQWLCNNILTTAQASCLATELPEAIVGLGIVWSLNLILFLRKREKRLCYLIWEIYAKKSKERQTLKT